MKIKPLVTVRAYAEGQTRPWEAILLKTWPHLQYEDQAQCELTGNAEGPFGGCVLIHKLRDEARSCANISSMQRNRS